MLTSLGSLSFSLSCADREPLEASATSERIDISSGSWTKCSSESGR